MPIPLFLGAYVWLDYSDINSLFQSTDTSSPITANGQSIGRASDKSGNGNHFTSINKPTFTTGVQNGLSGATFTNASQQTMFSSTIAMAGVASTMFVVVKGTTPVANARLGDFLANGQVDDFNNTGSAVFIYYPATTTVTAFRNGSGLSTSAITDNAFHQVGSIYDGANNTVYVDGTAAAPVANGDTFAATGVFTIAGRPNSGVDTLDGVIAEIVFFRYALNATQRALLRTYFTAKWNV